MQVGQILRYDRQLRMWDDQGQINILKSKVVILGVTLVSTEIVKNLLLAGIGEITLVDDRKLENADLYSNFALVHQIGKKETLVGKEPVSKILGASVQILNEDSKVSYLEKSPEHLIRNEMDLLNPFSIIVLATPVSFELYSKLIGLIYNTNNRKLLLKTCNVGLFGCLQLFKEEHLVINPHHEAPYYNIRTKDPFPELKDYFESFTLSETNLHDIPYPIVLYQYYQKWKTPFSKSDMEDDDKENFRNYLIKELQLPNNEYGNMKQLKSNLHRVWSETQVPHSLLQLLSHPNCMCLSEKSEIYWFIIRAIKDFTMINNGYAPVLDHLPDMESKTEYYLELLSVMKEKSKKDTLQTYQLAKKLIESIALSRTSELSLDLVKYYCSNSPGLQVLHLGRQKIYLDEHSFISEILDEQSHRSMDVGLTIFLILSLFSCFYKKSQTDNASLLDLMPLKQTSFLGSIPTSITGDYIQEMTRYENKEFSAVANILGGIASQEILKVITRHYSPIENTLVVNFTGSKHEYYTYSF